MVLPKYACCRPVWRTKTNWCCIIMEATTIVESQESQVMLQLWPATEGCTFPSYIKGKERAHHVGLPAWRRDRSSEVRAGKQGPARPQGGSIILPSSPILGKILGCDNTSGVSSMGTCATTILRTFPKTCPPQSPPLYALQINYLQ